jgi:hypothetical protein
MSGSNDRRKGKSEIERLAELLEISLRERRDLDAQMRSARYQLTENQA